MMPAAPTTTDFFLGGAVRLVQPANGAHRAGSDAVFLAATLNGASGLALDMGAGCGAVGLMAAQRNPGLEVHLAENDPEQLACAQASCDANPDLTARARVLDVDLLAGEPQRVAHGLARASYDHVLSNPPYRRSGHVRPSPQKAAAHVIDDAALTGWLRTAASALKPGGSLTVIFAADGLRALLRCFDGRFGAATILGLHPRAGAPAERLLVRAIKGRRTPPALLPGLILHTADGSYTQEAEAILEGRAPIHLTGSSESLSSKSGNRFCVRKRGKTKT